MGSGKKGSVGKAGAAAMLLLGLAGGTCQLANAAPKHAPLHQEAEQQQVQEICQKIGSKLSSVSTRECLDLGLSQYEITSVTGQPLLIKEFAPNPDIYDPPRILFLSGIHGDEYAAVSVGIKWLTTLHKHHSGRYHWLALPLVNPDGLLRKRSRRTNANAVDLNRNFQPADPDSMSVAYRQRRARVAPRYNPGPSPLSEPETTSVHRLIEEFKPHVIFSVHAPHGIVDFDGSQHAPDQLGPLQLQQMGTYPGSLGDYAWALAGIPLITIELPYAGIMPPQKHIAGIWVDLVAWLQTDLPKFRQTRITHYKAPESHDSL